MRVLLNELKKIFNWKYITAAIIVFIIISFLMPGELKWHNYIKTSYNSGLNAEEIIPEIAFKDMILDKYGSTIKKEQLSQIIADREEYKKNLNTAIINDKYCQYFGITSYDKIHSAELGDEYYDISPDGQQKHQIKEDEWSDALQNIRYNQLFEYNGAKYCGFFIHKYDNIISTMTDSRNSESQIDIYNIASDTIGSYDYTLQSYEVISVFRNFMTFQLIAVLFCSMIVILPYMVSENSSNTVKLQYTSKKGRKILRTKLLAVFLSSMFFVGSGCAVTAILFDGFSFGRYYPGIMKDAFYGYGITDNAVSVKEVPLFKALIIVTVCAAVLGIAICLITNAISSRFNNIITAFAACIPVIGVMSFGLARYVYQSFNPYPTTLLFESEGIAVTALFAMAAIITIIIQSKREKQRQF